MIVTHSPPPTHTPLTSKDFLANKLYKDDQMGVHGLQQYWDIHVSFLPVGQSAEYILLIGLYYGSIKFQMKTWRLWVPVLSCGCMQIEHGDCCLVTWCSRDMTHIHRYKGRHQCIFITKTTMIYAFIRMLLKSQTSLTLNWYLIFYFIIVSPHFHKKGIQ